MIDQWNILNFVEYIKIRCIEKREKHPCVKWCYDVCLAKDEGVLEAMKIKTFDRHYGGRRFDAYLKI